MHEWLSDAVERVRKTSRGGALPDKGIALEVPEEVETLEEGAGRGLLLKSVTMIEYTLIIACISLVIAVAGPPVAEAVQGQFNKVAEVISNGSTGGTGGGTDFPGGGSGGGNTGGNGGNQGGSGDGSGNTESDRDKDGIPDNEDAYPDDPLNGTGDKDGDGIMDKDDPYPDDPLNGKKPALTGSVSISSCIVGVKSTPSVSGTQDDASLTYSWFVGDAHVSDGQSYTFSPSQKDLSVYVVVKAANGDYDGEIRSNTVVVTARDLASVMSATMSAPVVGQQVSVNISQQPSDAVLGYSWMVDGAVVSTSSSYVPVKNDANKTLTVQITDKSGIYDGNVVATQTVSEPAKPRLTGELEISNATVGTTSAVFATDVPGNAEIEYVWYIDGVQAGTGTSHRFEAADKGKSVRVIGTDKSGTYSGSIKSNIITIGIRNITGTVTFSDPQVGATVTANVSGTPSDAKLAYSWMIDGNKVGTANTFKPTSAQAGKVLSVEVYDSAGIYDQRIASTGKTVLAQGVGESVDFLVSPCSYNNEVNVFSSTTSGQSWITNNGDELVINEAGTYIIQGHNCSASIYEERDLDVNANWTLSHYDSTGWRLNEYPIASASGKGSAHVNITSFSPITITASKGDTIKPPYRYHGVYLHSNISYNFTITKAR